MEKEIKYLVKEQDFIAAHFWWLLMQLYDFSVILFVVVV